jgi:hypothetical protein
VHQQQHHQQQQQQQQHRQQQQQQRVAITCAQTFFSGPDQKNNARNESVGNSSSVSQALVATNFITSSQGGDAANVVAVMGGDVGTAGSSTPSSGTVVFPRCDSVRSETAESSCSSLSSADSQPDAGTNSLALLLPSATAGHHLTSGNNPHLVTSGNNSLVHQNPAVVPPGLNSATGMVMLNNGVNVQQSGAQAAGLVRTPSGAISLSQQQLGNIVLAMAVPPNTASLNNSNLIQPTVSSVPVQPVVPTITVPFGWKRLHINGAIVYVRSVCSIA